MTARFSILPTIDGYDVIDNETGRPVDHRDNARSANGAAQHLNEALRLSNPSDATRCLASRLGARLGDPCDPDSIRAAFSDPMGHSRRELSVNY